MKCRHCNGTGVVLDWADLGRQLRRKRVEVGLSQKELATSLGMSAQYLCDLEAGRRSMSGPKGQLALAKFGLAPIELEPPGPTAPLQDTSDD